MNFPSELLNHILSYCSEDDIVSVACCSRRHHASIKHLLWKEVTIHYPFCGTLDNLRAYKRNRIGTDDYLRNLRFAESFCVEWIPHFASYHYTKCCDGSATTCEAHTETLIKFGINYTNLLKHFDVEKLQKLFINRVDVECLIQKTLEILKSAKEVHLSGIMLNDWSAVRELNSLKTLMLSECNAVDSTMEEILGAHRLIDLCLRRCSDLTQHSLVSIAKGGSLKKLTLQDLGSFDTEGIEDEEDEDEEDEAAVNIFNLEVLQTLRNLTVLSIDNVAIEDSTTSLNILWGNLSRLKMLELCQLRIEDESLSEIHLLSELETLQLHDGLNLTSNCLVYVTMLPSLRSFRFCTEMCSTEIEHERRFDTGGTRYKDAKNILLLNDMSTLRVLTLEKDREVDYQSTGCILEILCHQRRWGLEIAPIRLVCDDSAAMWKRAKHQDYILYRCKEAQ